jgi:hypothetical protein
VVHRLDTGVFAREVGALLAAARWSVADLEQILVTTARIDLADAGSWSREWTAAGGDAWAAARAGDRPGAYLHAASYYGAALAMIDESDGLVEERRCGSVSGSSGITPSSSSAASGWPSPTRRRPSPASSSPPVLAGGR